MKSNTSGSVKNKVTLNATADDTGSTSIAPSNPLTNSNGKSFLLFNSDWLTLQSFVAKTMQLPITTNDFTTAYGDFNQTDESDIESCVSALAQLQALAIQMGDPTTLLQKIEDDPSYVSDANNMPSEIYAQSIWLAGQLNSMASLYNTALSSFMSLYNGTTAQNAHNVRDLLTGPGGMQSNAQTALGYAQTVQTNLANFLTQFNTAAATVNTYASNDSQIFKDAVTAFGQDVSSILQLIQQAQVVHKQWEDYTIEATTISVGVYILSFGMAWPVSAVAAGVFGAAAKKAIDQYNTIVNTELPAAETDACKKGRLVIDLSSFNSIIGDIQTSLTNFQNDLQTITGVWMSQSTQLSNIANLDDDTLGDANKVAGAIDLLNAQTQWQTIASNTANFTTNCLVTYLNSYQFPANLPDSN